MRQQDQFRIFYNHTIHPELLRMERLRRRLIRLLSGSALLLGGMIALVFYVGEMVVILAFTIPTTLYALFLLVRVRRFVQTFKPRIMGLILEFIEGLPNMGLLKYDSQRFISQEIFRQSVLFAEEVVSYEGEDSIRGRIGEMDFELSELFVNGTSKVSGAIVPIFRGIFLHALFSEETHGSIVIWPRRRRQFVSYAIRDFTFHGGENADDEILNPAFRQLFMVYATKATHVAGILSEPIQEAIVHYSTLTGRDLFLAFKEKNIYLAVDGSGDILEPQIFRSNVRFDLVKGYLDDILLLLNIVADFDQMH